MVHRLCTNHLRRAERGDEVAWLRVVVGGATFERGLHGGECFFDGGLEVAPGSEHGDGSEQSWGESSTQQEPYADSACERGVGVFFGCVRHDGECLARIESEWRDAVFIFLFVRGGIAFVSSLDHGLSPFLVSPDGS